MQIIVHADDLGMSEATNEAIVEALRCGWCTSASLLANGPAFDHALRLLRAGLPDADVGIHLNLSAFAPLCPALLSSDLLDAAGHLGPAGRHARRHHLPGIRAEWRAQIARVRGAGIQPGHLDSHQHLHWQPLLRRALHDLAREAGIPCVRGLGGYRPGVDPIRSGLQRLRSRRHALSIWRAGLRSTEGFVSVPVFREIGPSLRLSSLEIMTHPGANPPEEQGWLESPWWRGLPYPVRRISWRQLS